MTKLKRSVYMVSDGTGITVESLANSLISQFETVHFEKKICRFVDSLAKIQALCVEIEQDYRKNQVKPLVFMTLVNPQMRADLKCSQACVFDLFDTFLSPMEVEIGVKASDTVGRAHALSDNAGYDKRIDAVNFALTYDDGLKPEGYEYADLILVGVSRCGKTPSCLYMALQYGIFSANYPFTLDDLEDHHGFPSVLKPYRAKLFGLTIDPQRLQGIRQVRRPNSPYSSIEQCRREVRLVEALYQRENIQYLDSTHFSIEEIATKIMSTLKPRKRY